MAKPEHITIYCQQFLENGGNQSGAYRTAFNGRCKNWKPETIHNHASKFHKSDEVQGRLAELQVEHAERHNVNIDSLTEDLEKARAKAMAEDKGASAAVTAIMGKARLHGLLIDKKQVDASVNHSHFKPEPISVTAQWLSGLLENDQDSETDEDLPT